MLTITSTSPPATDLGFLLHKHPDRLHSVDLSFGTAHVFYPEASAERCTAALLLDVDPVVLVRRGKDDAFPLAEYVSDRPYVASSFLSVAISRVFGTALGGRCARHPELPDRPLALSATLAPVPSRGGERFLRFLFEPLGYAVTAERHPLDPQQDWGDSPYFSVTLAKETRLADLLAHLRSRGVSAKRSLALREFALGLEALERSAAREPLRRVHECVFGVLALETEPLDPRL